MLNTKINVETDQFKGPLALLLFLIQKEDVKIDEINLSTITKQYLDYIGKMKDLNFDLAGEYLLMASILLYLKSMQFVEGKEEASEEALGNAKILSREDLVYRLKKTYLHQIMGSIFQEFPYLGKDFFSRGAKLSHIKDEVGLKSTGVDQLSLIYAELKNKKDRKPLFVKRDEISVGQKLDFLKNYFKEGTIYTFPELCGDNASISNKVVTFITLLELGRKKKVRVIKSFDQKSFFVEISDKLDNLDLLAEEA